MTRSDFSVQLSIEQICLGHVANVTISLLPLHFFFYFIHSRSSLLKNYHPLESGVTRVGFSAPSLVDMLDFRGLKKIVSHRGDKSKSTHGIVRVWKKRGSFFPLFSSLSVQTFFFNNSYLLIFSFLCSNYFNYYIQKKYTWLSLEKLKEYKNSKLLSRDIWIL